MTEPAAGRTRRSLTAGATMSLLAALLLGLGPAGCGGGSDEPAEPAESATATGDAPAVEATADPPRGAPVAGLPGETVHGQPTVTPTGLEIWEIEVGDGEEALPAPRNCVIHYESWLADGTPVDSTRRRGQPLVRPIGQMLEGLSEGLTTMRVGGRRKLRVPPSLGYGDRAFRGVPANSTLVIDVELVDVRDYRPVPEPGSGAIPGLPVEGEPVVLESGLKYWDIEPGSGPPPPHADVSVEVVYQGYLNDGTLFHDSSDRDRPFDRPLSMMFDGWVQGVGSMRPGGLRKLIVPWQIGFGERPVQTVPAYATMIIDVRMRRWQDYTAVPPELPGRPVESEWTVTDSGLRYVDLVEGDGEMPADESTWMKYHVIAWLNDGTLVADSRDASAPNISSGARTLPGIAEALSTMREGGVRKCLVPPELMHGDEGTPTVPPKALMVLEIELLEIPDFAAIPADESLPGADVTGEPEILPGGLMVYELDEGDGPLLQGHETFRAKYTGWLNDGTLLDTSDRKDEGVAMFSLQPGRVLEGWRLGLRGIRVGGKRKLVIPSQYAYGERGLSFVPADATVVFDIEVVGIVSPEEEAALSRGLPWPPEDGTDDDAGDADEPDGSADGSDDG